MDAPTSAAEYQYEYDGQRIARGTFRLGFRSLVPAFLTVGAWSEEIGLFVGNEFGAFARNSAPTIQSWGVSCAVLVNTEDPFSQDEVPTLVQLSEPFTVAGRCKVRLSVPSSPLLQIGQAYDIVFRIIGNDKAVSPVIPPHPLIIQSTASASQAEDEEDWLSCCRLIVPSINWHAPPRLIIGEASSNLGIGGKVWDGSLTMLEFLFAEEQRWSRDLGLPDHEGCKIVDLGAGTGILGFGVALLKPQCTIVNTDLPEVVPLLEMNAIKNGLNRRNCISEAYSWGSEPSVTSALHNADIIIMCDVVYDETCYQPLLDSLVKLRAKHVLMSHRHRNRSEIAFFLGLAKIGQIECIKLPILGPDDPYQAILASIPLCDTFLVKDNLQNAVDDVAVYRIRL